MVTLVCLTNSKHDGFRRFYVFPQIEKLIEYQIRGEGDPWLKGGEKLRSLKDFCDTVKRISREHFAVA